METLTTPMWRQHAVMMMSRHGSMFHITGLCAGNPPVIGEFPAQRASNAEL